MSTHSIVVAQEFSETPAGRFVTDGPYSGEVFRETLLYPNLQKFDLVEVDLDGTLGCGSSFLDEAFGGLVREKHMTVGELKRKLQIKTRRRFYEARIWQYISAQETIQTG